LLDLEEEALTADIDRQEAIYTEIDTLKDQAYEVSESVLEEIMPEAFAVVKETAKRFVQAIQIEVTATPFDRELSATRDICNFKWKQSYLGKFLGCRWTSQVTWDMIHYDVQLIGGICFASR
jgi:preprotein translocase subunit SecA